MSGGSVSRLLRLLHGHAKLGQGRAFLSRTFEYPRLLPDKSSCCIGALQGRSSILIKTRGSSSKQFSKGLCCGFQRLLFAKLKQYSEVIFFLRFKQDNV